MGHHLFARPRSFFAGALLAAAAMLGACGSGGDDDLAALDNQIIANDSDPALTSALEDQIMVDPALAAQSNKNAVRGPETPMQAPYPVPTATPTTVARPAAAAAAASFAGVRERLGADQGGACLEGFDYNRAWADRLPPAFAVYPGGKVSEAAANNSNGCSLRVVTFSTGAGSQRLLDWYHTKAVRGGYTSEHQLRDGDNVLAGVNPKTGAAFYLIVTPKSPGSEVALIASLKG